MSTHHDFTDTPTTITKKELYWSLFGIILSMALCTVVIFYTITSALHNQEKNQDIVNKLSVACSLMLNQNQLTDVCLLVNETPHITVTTTK